MSTDPFIEYEGNSSALRPLGELPTLRLVDAERDVRGWEIRAQDGQLLGAVADILIDVDRLEANSLLVSLAGGHHQGRPGVVPLRALAPEDRTRRRLTLGDGMAPIRVRYQSTTRLALWAAIAIAIVTLAWWVMGAFG